MSQHIVNRLIKQVERLLHGAKREQILRQLEENPTADNLAQTTYDLVISMDQQASQGGASLGIDVLLAVAVEIIDLLLEMLEAMGIKFKPDEMREESLIKLVMLHMQAVEGDPEEQAAARELLEEMMADGSVDQTMEHINQVSDASPKQMRTAAQQMTAPRRKPIAAGVEQGLMQPGVQQ